MYYFRVITVFVFLLLSITTNAQKYDSDVWHFSKSKNHLVLSIAGLIKVNDTLSLTINGKDIYNNYVIDSCFFATKATSNINQESFVTYFAILSNFNQIKYMYNSQCFPDIYHFDKQKNATKYLKIAFSLNGERKIYEMDVAHRWLVIIIAKDFQMKRSFDIWSKRIFSGFD